MIPLSQCRMISKFTKPSPGQSKGHKVPNRHKKEYTLSRHLTSIIGRSYFSIIPRTLSVTGLLIRKLSVAGLLIPKLLKWLFVRPEHLMPLEVHPNILTFDEYPQRDFVTVLGFLHTSLVICCCPSYYRDIGFIF